MDLEQLKQQWVKSSGESGALQAKIWDDRAEAFGNKAIPQKDEHPFLKMLYEKVKPDAKMAVLDIGCGAGQLSIALADCVKEVVGVDVSTKMIELAGKAAEERGLSNTRFFAGDWSDWDLEKYGFKEKFDLVFAHMTPAVCDYMTMEQMNACAKGHCFLVKPARRKDSVQDAAFELVGITSQGKQFDDTISNAFTYLWQKGYSPEIFYREELWEKEMTVKEMCGWCVNRAKLQKPITEEEEQKICQYIQEKSIDGNVKEMTETMIVTMYWHV